MVEPHPYSEIETTTGTDSHNESVGRIVEAAIHCFARLGYEGASTKEIAQAAGVSKSLLHYHFDSKEDILIEAVTSMSMRLAREVQSRIESQTPSVERALNAAEALFDLLITNKERVSFLLEMFATANHNERLRVRLDEFDRVQSRLVRDTLESALGPVKESLAIPVDRMVLLVQSIISGLAVQSRFVDRPAEMRALFDDVKQVLIRGVFALKPD